MEFSYLAWHRLILKAAMISKRFNVRYSANKYLISFDVRIHDFDESIPNLWDRRGKVMWTNSTGDLHREDSP